MRLVFQIIKNTILSAGIILSVALAMSVLTKADFSTPAFAQCTKIDPTMPNYILTPKANLNEAIRALNSGDNVGALFHLNEVNKDLVHPSDQTAREHIELGMRAVKANDIQGALVHLDAADRALPRDC